MHKRRFALALALALGLTAVPPGAAGAEAPGIKDGERLTEEIAASVANISTEDLRLEVERNPDLVLIDIRTPTEVEAMGGAIKAPQNVNIPRGWLEFRVTQHARSPQTPIVVYCGANIRSPLAAYTLQQMGYTHVRNYADGFIGWKGQGLPVE
jgi:rhodanese-related sulfurtransferase